MDCDYENPWTFGNDCKCFSSDAIGDFYGFVYLITNKSNGKRYVGRKYFWSFRKPKGKKRKVKQESDWKKYYGSCPELKEDIKKYGYDWAVTASEHQMSVSIQEQIDKREKLSELFLFADKEVPFISEWNGIPIKGKVDAITEIDGMTVIVDLKTTGKEVTNFPKSARSFDYDRQAYFYLKLTGADAFMFVPVEKSFPYTPALYTASEEFVSRGEYKFNKAMNLYKRLFIDDNYNDSYLIEEYL